MPRAASAGTRWARSAAPTRRPGPPVRGSPGSPRGSRERSAADDGNGRRAAARATVSCRRFRRRRRRRSRRGGLPWIAKCIDVPAPPLPARYRPSVGSESTLRARSDLAGREAGRRTDRILPHPGTSSRPPAPKVALSASSAHPSMLDSLRCLVRVVAAVAVTATAVAAPVRTAHVEAELVSSATALTPDKPLTVALRLKMDKGWHTYWQNPGESGLPTKLAWRLPAGMTAGSIQWPPPRTLPVGPLINYGYEGEVLLLTDIAATSALPSAGPATLRARADWLVCKEICIPEGADLALKLPV